MDSSKINPFVGQQLSSLGKPAAKAPAQGTEISAPSLDKTTSDSLQLSNGFGVNLNDNPAAGMGLSQINFAGLDASKLSPGVLDGLMKNLPMNESTFKDSVKQEFPGMSGGLADKLGKMAYEKAIMGFDKA